VVFNNEKCEVIFNNKVILTGHKDPSTDLWTLTLPTKRMWTSPTLDAVTTPTSPRPGPCIDRVPHPPKGQSETHPGVNVAAFTHLVRTRTNAIKFTHQSLCSPKISLLHRTEQLKKLGTCYYYLDIVRLVGVFIRQGLRHQTASQLEPLERASLLQENDWLLKAHCHEYTGPEL
jgi:hypothetical protein